MLAVALLLFLSLPSRIVAAAACDGGCSAYPSLIVLNQRGQRQAGLGDRSVMLHGVANLAASLCARVYAPPPCRLLNKQRHSVRAYTGIFSPHAHARCRGSTAELRVCSACGLRVLCVAGLCCFAFVLHA